MNKHTPEPWTLAIVAEAGHDLKGRRDFRGSIFCEERDDYGKRKTVISASGTAEEDWALIAAAPDLLSAANKAVKLIRGCGFAPGSPVLRALNAAIAKAEGR